MPLQKIIHFLSERPFQSNVLASKSIFQPLRLIFQRGFGQVFRNYNSKINVQPRIYMLIPGTLYRYSKALSSRGAVKVSLMERVLFLSTEPGCRSTISKNCKHHYFSCKKVDTAVEILVWHPAVDFPEVGLMRAAAGAASGRTKGCCVSPSFVNPPHPKASSYAKKSNYFGQLAKISDSSPPSWMSDGTLYKQKYLQNVLTGGLHLDKITFQILTFPP